MRNFDFIDNFCKLNKGMNWYLYKIKHLVVNNFTRLKHFRAVATRCDKLKRNDESTVSLVYTLI